MAPPLPPPGVPARAGLAPVPTAVLPARTQLSTVQDTPMLLRAPPLAQAPPWNVLFTTYTGSPRYWSSTRIAAPPRSGPVRSHSLRRKREFTTLNRPPRMNTAPPPPPSVVPPVALPSANVRFCTVSRGVSWLSQCDVVQPCAASHVFWYRIRCRPPPDSVTRPPPSSTTSGPFALRTFAVADIDIVTGAGPHANVMMPPAATATTTATDVQLSGVPVPTTRVGWDVSTARASAGTVAAPAGLPGGAAVVGPGTDGAGVTAAAADPLAAAAEAGPGAGLGARCGEPQPASTATSTTGTARRIRIGPTLAVAARYGVPDRAGLRRGSLPRADGRLWSLRGTALGARRERSSTPRRRPTRLLWLDCGVRPRPSPSR